MLSNSVLNFKSDTYSRFLDEDVIELLSKNFVIPDDFTYQTVKVSRSMVSRPDLLSYNLYSDDSYGDLLCKLNGISNPFELAEGTVMVCPVPSELYKFLAADPYAEEKGPVRPKAKRKKEKRRPNEATEDDTRYTVDSNRRIVVY